MRAATGLYRLNLIRDLREREKRIDQRRRLAVILGLGSFGFFLISLLYSGMTMWQMERVISLEKEKLERLQADYRKYTAARLIVDKSDIELLSGLQGRGIFWTRKLAALAKHLPDNFWITAFRYNGTELRITGYGNLSARQDHLLILEGYLKEMRQDTSFADVFPALYLNRVDREGQTGRIAFEVSALGAGRNGK